MGADPLGPVSGEVGFSCDAHVWAVDRVTAAPDSMLAEPAWTSAAAALLDGGSQPSLWARAPMTESDHSRAGTAHRSCRLEMFWAGPSQWLLSDELASVLWPLSCSDTLSLGTKASFVA